MRERMLFKEKFKAVAATAEPEAEETPAPPARDSPSASSARRDDDPEKRRRTIFVGNVPSSLTKKALRKLFGQFGAIESTRFRSQPLNLENKMPYQDTALTRRIAAVKGLVHSERTQKAYVVYKTAEDAEKALQLNMTKVGDKHIMVDFAGTKSSSKEGAAVQYDPTMSVFLGNLPIDVEEEDIITFFDQADHVPQVQSQIKAVRVVHDKATGLGKGFGYVLFKTKSAAKAALALKGEDLKGREVRIMKVKAGGGGGGDASKPGSGGGEGKRKKLGAFKRRKSGSGAKNGAPAWQGMKAKAKIGKTQGAKGKAKGGKALSEIIKKAAAKPTAKNKKKREAKAKAGASKGKK